MRVAKSARTTLPPSIGNAGNILNTTSEMLTSRIRSANEPVAMSISARLMLPRVTYSQTQAAAASHDIDGRTGQRNPQFLARVVRHSFKARNPSDREKRDVFRTNPVTFCRQGVSEFMQDDASE